MTIGVQMIILKMMDGIIPIIMKMVGQLMILIKIMRMIHGENPRKIMIKII